MEVNIDFNGNLVGCNKATESRLGVADFRQHERLLPMNLCYVIWEKLNTVWNVVNEKAPCLLISTNHNA